MATVQPNTFPSQYRSRSACIFALAADDEGDEMRGNVPAVSLDEKNPEKTKQAEASSGLDLTRPDAADDEIFNRILWSTIKGEYISYPPPAFAHGQ
jgi:hypothetical protein